MFRVCLQAPSSAPDDHRLGAPVSSCPLTSSTPRSMHLPMLQAAPDVAEQQHHLHRWQEEGQSSTRAMCTA